MFDIHYHLLYGIDDGPKNLAESLALAEASISEGVTHVVATPHANSLYPFQPEAMQRQLIELNGYLNGRITLGLGCDFHITSDNIEDALANPRKYTINGGSYLLIEFSDHGIPLGWDNAMFELQSAGMKLIITHPERNPVLSEKPDRLERWIQSNCFVQITADSLLGRFGKRAQAVSRDYLARDWVHFIASDAHSIEKRPPRLGRAYELVEKEFGAETADRLLVRNPRAAYMDENMPSQPEPASCNPHRTGGRKSSLLSRWFGR